MDAGSFILDKGVEPAGEPLNERTNPLLEPNIGYFSRNFLGQQKTEGSHLIDSPPRTTTTLFSLHRVPIREGLACRRQVEEDAKTEDAQESYIHARHR